MTKWLIEWARQPFHTVNTYREMNIRFAHRLNLRITFYVREKPLSILICRVQKLCLGMYAYTLACNSLFLKSNYSSLSCKINTMCITYVFFIIPFLFFSFIIVTVSKLNGKNRRGRRVWVTLFLSNRPWLVVLYPAATTFVPFHAYI